MNKSVAEHRSDGCEGNAKPQVGCHRPENIARSRYLQVYHLPIHNLITGCSAMSSKNCTAIWRQTRDRPIAIALVTSLLLILFTWIDSASAQAAYPVFQDPHINDYADVLSPEEEATVRNAFSTFRNETGIHAVVLTVNSIGDYDTGDPTIESFATNVFNTWGIGDARRNDGILLLVAPGDRKVRLELGQGYPASDDRVAQIIIDNAMLPQFREGRISQGTVAGAQEIVKRFDPERHPAWGLIDGVDLPLADDVKGPVGIIGALMAAAAAGLGSVKGMAWYRRRERNCPTCQIPMRRLDEHEDDRYLESGQRREEQLKSVDYDVWLCSRCGHHQALSYQNFFSRFQKCPQCHHKTMKVTTKTVVSPTYSSSGKAKVTEDCQYCDHHQSHTRVIPRKTRSSSSSSSSGGGGSSSGGGASGSW